MVNVLSDRSKKIINFFHEFKYIDNKKILLNKKTNKFLYYTYNNLKQVNSRLLKMEYSPQISIVDSKLLHDKNKYISDEIHSYINKEALYKIKYLWQKDERTVDLIFIVFSEKDIKNINKYNHYAHRVFLILEFLFMYSNKHCSKSQEINVYMTPFKRELPSNKSETILGPIHVNGGLSYACPINGLITIFREQEWFKVLIHESFHNLGLDFSNMDLNDFNKKMHMIFPLNSKFNLFEAYCEFWALTLNVIITSFLIDNTAKTYNIFLDRFKKYMLIEQKFTYLQVYKILDYMGLDYIDLFEKGERHIIARQKYKENTNILSYYIFKMMLLSDYNKFIVWCTDNNNNILDFNKTNLGLDNIFKYILKIYKSDYIINNINVFSRFIFNERKIFKTRKKIREKLRDKKFKTTTNERYILHRRSSQKYKTKNKKTKFLEKGLCLTSIELK